MEITDVRIKLTDDGVDSNERLRAFCSITIDDIFVVHDLRIIEGAKGHFVAMPSRKLTDRCRKCGAKNHLTARYCASCAAPLGENRAAADEDGRPARLHADIAHPINPRGRRLVQDAVLDAYREEVELSRQPGYVSRYEQIDFDTPYGR